MNTIILLTFIGYMLVILMIAWLGWKNTHTQSDYILGGRRLGRWVAALSAQASDMSGWLLLGLPGYAYVSGLESLWLAGGLFIGVYLNWRLVAPRLRRFSESLQNSLTIPEYLSRRFSRHDRLLRLVSAFFILIFFLFYTSSGLVAGGKLFNTVFNWPYEWAVITGAVIIVAYTLVGGFLAVSWTDTFQALLMLLALMIVPLVAFSVSGGAVSGFSQLNESYPALLNPMTDKLGQPLGTLAIISLLAWGLGYFGQPHILARFMAIRNVGDIRVARWLGSGWSALAIIGGILTGLAGLLVLDNPLSGSATETVFMQVVELLFHPVLAGIWLAAILAAVMSTADSQLLVASSAISEDIYRGLIDADASERKLIWIGRIAVLVIALLATALAMDPDRQILDLVAYAWAGFGACFGPVILLSLYWDRMTASGALAGMLAGGLTVILWKQLSGGIFDLYEIVPGIIAATLMIGLVSIMSVQSTITASALAAKK